MKLVSSWIAGLAISSPVPEFAALDVLSSWIECGMTQRLRFLPLLYRWLLVSLFCYWLIGRADGRGFLSGVPLTGALKWAVFPRGVRQRRREQEGTVLWWEMVVGWESRYRYWSEREGESFSEVKWRTEYAVTVKWPLSGLVRGLVMGQRKESCEMKQRIGQRKEVWRRGCSHTPYISKFPELSIHRKEIILKLRTSDAVEWSYIVITCILYLHAPYHSLYWPTS